MSQQDLAAPASSGLTVASSVLDGLGYPNHRSANAAIPTGWLNGQPEGLRNIGTSTQSPAGKTESGS